MSHFKVEDWVDFVRKVKSRRLAAEMEQHLKKRCQECRKDVRVWQGLLAFGAEERRYFPPEHAFRLVRGYYNFLKPGKRGGRVPSMARLLFDSFLDPVPAGIRSSHSSPRQLVYSAGNLLIDLRLEHRLGRVYIVGQAQSRSLRDPETASREVLALQGTKAVARARCNEFGEFQFDVEADTGEDLSIVLKGPKTCVLPLYLAG